MSQLSSTKSVNITSLAGQLQLSTATVSKALRYEKGVNKDTAERVRDLAQRLGYKPNIFAQGLKKQKSKFIGFLLTTELTNSWYAELVSWVEVKLRERDYALMLGVANRDEKREVEYLDMFESSFLSGIIAGPLFAYRDLAPFENIMRSDSPLVTFACVEDIPISHVKIDHIASIRKVVRYFVECGHKRIGYFCCTKRELRSSGVTRKAGFDEALIEEGLPFIGKDIIICDWSDLTYAGGFRIMSELIEERGKDLPTAFFCHCDEVALGALDACRATGVLVPDDISFIGYDGIARTANSLPALTTVGGMMEQLADKLAELLFEGIEGKLDKVKSVAVEPQLIIRDSVAKI